jgi:hypothetical protein
MGEGIMKNSKWTMTMGEGMMMGEGIGKIITGMMKKGEGMMKMDEGKRLPGMIKIGEVGKRVISQ